MVCKPGAIGPASDNPNCARTYAAFRLVGEDLDPEAVSRALGLEPDVARAKGEEITAGRVGPARQQRTGIWSLSTENHLTSTSLDSHLGHLLGRIEPSRSQLEALRRDDDIRADFLCYWRSATGHGGPEVSAETLGRIAALGASLGIDFYGAG